MIVLFTDFGANDLYVGQVKAVLHQHLPKPVPIVDLLHDAPAFNVSASAHLLAALCERFPAGSVFLAVVDPGVGSERDAIILRAADQWFVGPDNGLLSVIAARAGAYQAWRIVWRPDSLSASFHGRDLFAPIAARLAGADFPSEKLEPLAAPSVRLNAGDLAQVIYIDHYGNAMTGVRAASVSAGNSVIVSGQRIAHARVFSALKPGELCWYANSIDLVEIALCQGSAAGALGLKIGDAVAVS